MHQKYPNAPPENALHDVWQVIIDFLPLIWRIRTSGISRSFYNAIRDSKIDSKQALSIAYDSDIPPENIRRGLEGFFSQKIDLKVLKQSSEVLKQSSKDLKEIPEKILLDSILYILMVHLYSINSDTLQNASATLLEHFKQIKEELVIGKQTSYDGLFTTTLMNSLYMTRYAKGSQAYKTIKNQTFLEFSRDNTIFINFSGGNLSGENLTRANFPGSNFVGTNLKYSIFDQSNFAEANLRESEIDGASFKGSNLMGANLSGARGTPKFDRYTILIGTQMSWCLERAAKESGAIFTLTDLAERIREKPEAFPNPEMLFIKGFRILLKNKIDNLESIPYADRDSLVKVKLNILRLLEPIVKNAEKTNDIAALRNEITSVINDTNMREIDTNRLKTKQEILSVPRAVLSYTLKEIAKGICFYSDSIRTDSQDIIDDAKSGLNILENYHKLNVNHSTK